MKKLFNKEKNYETVFFLHFFQVFIFYGKKSNKLTKNY